MNPSWRTFMSIRLRKALLFFRILLPDMIFWQSLREGGRKAKSLISPLALSICSAPAVPSSSLLDRFSMMIERGIKAAAVQRHSAPAAPCCLSCPTPSPL